MYWRQEFSALVQDEMTASVGERVDWDERSESQRVLSKQFMLGFVSSPPTYTILRKR